MKRYGNILIRPENILGATVTPPSIYLKDGRIMTVDKKSLDLLINSYSDTTIQMVSETENVVIIESSEL
jgi:Mn2+/Fe2+ NRAMP family transporter